MIILHTAAIAGFQTEMATKRQSLRTAALTPQQTKECSQNVLLTFHLVMKILFLNFFNILFFNFFGLYVRLGNMHTLWKCYF